MKSRFSFLSGTVAELKKVIWPTRQETVRLVIMVLVVCIAIGAFLWIIDQFLFTNLFLEKLLPGGR